jgi:hypothetical protein
MMPDVVFHEYGHGVNDNLYRSMARRSACRTARCTKGLADVNAAMIQDNPGRRERLLRPRHGAAYAEQHEALARGSKQCDPHLTGLIVGGAFWDLREAIGLALTEHLAHFMKWGTPETRTTAWR